MTLRRCFEENEEAVKLNNNNEEDGQANTHFSDPMQFPHTPSSSFSVCIRLGLSWAYS